MTGNLTAGAILNRTVQLLAAYPLPALLCFLLFVVPSVLIDTYREEDLTALNLVINIGAVFAQYYSIKIVLRGEGLYNPHGLAGRGGTFFGVLLITGIAIGIGTLLLILPGLYLYARWSIAAPLVVAEGATFSEALDRSTEWSRENLFPIMIALGVVGLTLPASLLLFYVYPAGDYPPVPLAVLANSLIFGGSILGWYVSIALFTLMRRGQPGLEDVFA